MVAGIDEVVAEGEGALAQLLDLVMVGDFVTLHRAAQEGVDPGPVPVLDDIKRRSPPTDRPPAETGHLRTSNRAFDAQFPGDLHSSPG